MTPDHHLSISDGVNPVTFDVVAHVEDADYSWSAEAVLKRRPDGALFFVTDCGCSCNSFGEFLTVADLKPIRRISEAYKMTSDRENLERSYRTREMVYR